MVKMRMRYDNGINLVQVNIQLLCIIYYVFIFTHIKKYFVLLRFYIKRKTVIGPESAIEGRIFHKSFNNHFALLITDVLWPY